MKSFARRAGGTLMLAASSAISFAQQPQSPLPNFDQIHASAPAVISDHDNEVIEPYLGSLRLSSVDLRIEGPGGFDLEVVRSYNSARVGRNWIPDHDAHTSKPVGWTMHFGRLLVRYRNCNGSASNTNFMPMLETADGKRRLVWAVTQAGSPPMMTSDNWSVACNGSGYVVFSPDGRRYDMQHVHPGGLTTCPNPTNPGQSCYLSIYSTTRITDRNGNYADIAYSAYVNGRARAGADWNEPKIDGVTASDGRALLFSYAIYGETEEQKKPYLLSVTSNAGQRVEYTYQRLPGNWAPEVIVLTGFRDLAGRNWAYQYQIPKLFTDWRCSIQITCEYVAGDLLLKSITSPFGGSRSFEWTAVPSRNHRDVEPAIGVARKLTSDGGVWSFFYSKDSASSTVVTTVTGPAGTTVYRHRFEGNNDGGALGIRPPFWTDGLLLSQADGSVQTTTNTWRGQPISDNWATLLPLETQFPPEFVRPILQSRVTVRDGAVYQTTQSSFSKFGSPGTIEETGPNGGSRRTDVSYFADSLRWIIDVPKDEVVVGVGSVWRAFAANGNLLSETRDNVATSHTYYPSGDIETTTRPRGLVTAYGNYFRGVAQSENQPEGVNIIRVVSPKGTVVSETNGEGHTTSFTYDGLNRLTRASPPLGSEILVVYGANTRTISRGDLHEVTTFDGFGRAVSVNAGGYSTAFEYDPLGRMTYESISGYPSIGHRYTYDILDRRTGSLHNADGSSTRETYSSLAGVPTRAVQDERGFVTTYKFRAFGDPSTRELMSILSPVPEANVEIQRNGRGLVTSVSQGGVSHTFGYDNRYYVDRSTSPELGTIRFQRDEAGNVKERLVESGAAQGSAGTPQPAQTTRFEYDGRNRLTKTTFHADNPSPSTRTYWRNDKLKSLSNGSVVRNLGYDANGNLIRESLLVDGQDMVAQYEYNNKDQISAIVYPVLGRRVAFQLNSLGWPTMLSVPAGWMASASHWPSGQIYNITYAGGTSATYGRTGREWINSITVRSGGDNLLRISTSMVYDVTGNLLAATDSLDSRLNRSFQYDGIGRMVVADGPWGAGTVQYSGVGNIQNYNLGADRRWYAYDSRNRLTSVSATGLGSVTYTYDVNGNASPASTPYVYDNANNLIGTGPGRTNLYDGANLRVKTITGGVSHYEFRSADGLLLTEWRKEACCYDRLTEHLYLGTTRVAAQTTDFLGASIAGLYWDFYQPDAAGSTIASIYSGSFLGAKESYRPYGERVINSPSGNQIWFTGHKQDADNLIYMGARYYNPQTGRFLSIDPEGIAPENLHSINRYAYANNNPARYKDPDGRWPALIPDEMGGGVSRGRSRTGAVIVRDASGRAIPQTAADRQANLQESRQQQTSEPGAAPATKGRLGSQATRQHIDDVASAMEGRGWTITHGGGPSRNLKEEFLPGPGGGRKGSSYPDISATKDGKTLRVNTIDTRADGVTPTTREATNAARIRSQTSEHLLLIPKP